MPTDTFQESAEKKSIRGMLSDAAGLLGRVNLTYLGLPGHRALDILALRAYLDYAICVDRDKKVLDACSASIAGIPLKGTRYVAGDIWDYLNDTYRTEPRVADVTFLDFCGGGINSSTPFAHELGAIRTYFAKQARHPNKAFILAWTYMPHDTGASKYQKALEKVLQPADLQRLANAKGTAYRSVAIRCFLKQCLVEHDMSAKLYHHALYKKTMNTIILIYARGTDASVKVTLGLPEDIMSAFVTRYDGKSLTPDVISLE